MTLPVISRRDIKTLTSIILIHITTTPILIGLRITPMLLKARIFMPTPIGRILISFRRTSAPIVIIGGNCGNSGKTVIIVVNKSRQSPAARLNYAMLL